MMRRIVFTLAALLMTAQLAAAQGQQTGTLQGTVTDSSGLALPGVMVTLRSDALQGTRDTVTGASGEYVVRGLPPGTYEVQFELSGFTTGRQQVTVALGLPTEVDVELAPAGVTEAVDVVAETNSTIVTPAASANYTAAEIDTLATGRTLADIAEIAPGLTANTPNADQVTISGSFSYDNVFLVDGVDINDNLFGSPDDLFIEEAIEQTQVITSGVSAEYGRFSGGVINAITKSGGNVFSGSFRTDLENPAWRDENPFEEENDTTRPDDLGKVFQATLGGPIVRDRLWFFGAGRWEDATDSEPLPQTGIQFDQVEKDRRYEIKLTGTVARNHTLQGSYFRNRLEQDRVTFPFSIDPRTRIQAKTPSDRVVTNYRGVLRSNLFAEAQFSRKKLGFRNNGGTSTNIFDSPFITLTQDLGHYNAPYFDSTDPEDRDNQQLTGSLSWFLSGTRSGSHDIKAGVERFTATNTGGNSQSATNYVFDADYLTDDAGNPVFVDGGLVPVFVPGATILENWLPVRGATIDITTTSVYAQDRWTPVRQLSLDLGIRYERVRSDATGGIVGVDTDTVVPRLAATYDPLSNGRWVLQATYAHYAGKYSEAQFANNTNVGNPARVFGIYTGPAGEGRDFAPGFDPANYQTILGIFPTANVFFDDGLSAPVTREVTASLGMQLARGYVKGTYVNRDVSDFVEDFITLENGSTEVTFEGQDFGSFANRVFRNTDEPVRRYQGLVFQGRYRLTSAWSVYGSSTVQLKNEGNYEGEATNQPAISSDFGDFPEAFVESRHFPVGRLASFQRHKARLWTTYLLGLGRAGSVDAGFAYRYDSPLSYSLVATGLPLTEIQEARLADYASTTSSQDLFFGRRGAELFPNGSHLFDLAVTYSLPVLRTLRPYVKLDMRNVFNTKTLIQHDTTIEANFDGPLDELGLPTTFERGPRFGQATDNDHYPLPREFRIAFGFRF
ncbi:MAG TPA: TonB-dependent receptor [Vicinamibacterales bacterium]